MKSNNPLFGILEIYKYLHGWLIFGLSLKCWLNLNENYQFYKEEILNWHNRTWHIYRFPYCRVLFTSYGISLSLITRYFFQIPHLEYRQSNHQSCHQNYFWTTQKNARISLIRIYIIIDFYKGLWFLNAQNKLWSCCFWENSRSAGEIFWYPKENLKSWKETLSFSFQNSAAIFVPRCVQPSHHFPRSLILDLGPKRSERRKKDLKMWIPIITLAALLGHTSGQFQQPFPQNGFPQSGFPQAQSAFPQGAFPQTGFPSIWETIAQSR